MAINERIIGEMLKAVRPLMQQIVDAPNISERLYIAAQWHQIDSGIRDIITALVEATEPAEQREALEAIDEGIASLSKGMVPFLNQGSTGSYDPNNSDPQA